MQGPLSGSNAAHGQNGKPLEDLARFARFCFGNEEGLPRCSETTVMERSRQEVSADYKMISTGTIVVMWSGHTFFQLRAEA
jgi:hypothetical protein